MSADCVNVGYWRKLDDERIECGLCPRFCKVRPGQRGLCFVRRARADGAGMELTGYGRSTGFCVDPIEKKPLNHFLPGSSSCRSARRAATSLAPSVRTTTFPRAGKSRA